MRDNHRPEHELFVDINKKENRKPGSNLDLEPGPFVSLSLSLSND